jgi:predicted ATPase/DNA-binding SARP family transcriptional activator
MEAVLTAPWRILLLGGLRAEQNETSIARFRSQKIGALLAYLALFPTRAYTREELADLFWPDAEPEVGRTNLRTALFSLRRQLEPPGAPAGSVLITRGHSDVGIEPRAITTDVAAFDSALQTAAQSTLPANERVVLFEEAVSLYKGPLLPGFNETWAVTERGRLAEAYHRALQKLVVHYEQIEDYNRALELARRMLTVDLLDENTHADIIRFLMLQGQHAAAKRQYEETRRTFKTELGREPSSEVAALLETRFPTPKRRADSAATTSPVSQLEPAPTPVPAMSASPAVTPLHLPLTLTRFFGREEERGELAVALRSPDIRLVTLTGFGGCGKTRLAVEIAREVADTFPGGIWFIALAELRDATRLFDVIGDTLGLPRTTSAEQTQDQIAERLNSDEHRRLLILDNFEQIVDEGAAEIQTLLGRAPRVSCLVTSRHRLLLDGEREFSLLPLPTPVHVGTPERLLEYASVQLFVNRAQSTRPDFQLSSRNAVAIAQICARLEGIPLAIELAAAWSQTLTPAQMLERLIRRFDLLISRRRDIPSRQATLRATIEWSYNLLPVDLQTFFMQLSVFRGGWTLEAAEAVTGNPLTIASLAELEQRSLLVTKEITTTTAMNFRMLETVREFASEQLNRADTETAHLLRQRHATFFADFADQADKEFHGPDAVDWLDRLEADHDNFRAALEWVIDHPEEIERGLRIAAGLHRFWYMRGYLSEGRRWLSTVLQLSGKDDPTAIRAAALAAAAGLAGAEGDIQSADSLYTEALATQRTCKDLRGVAISLCHLGLVASGRNEHSQARALYQESLQLSREIGDEGNAAHVLKCLGVNTLIQDNSEEAESLFEESLAMYRRFGDKRGIAMVLGELGQLSLIHRKDYKNAALYLDEHLQLSRQINDVVHTARALVGLGRLALIQEDYDLAKTHLQESLGLFRIRGYEWEVLSVLGCFVDLAIAQNQAKRAVRIEAAASALWCHLNSAHVEYSQMPHKSFLTELRKTLGAETFEILWAEGSAMNLDQIVPYIMGND